MSGEKTNMANVCNMKATATFSRKKNLPEPEKQTTSLPGTTVAAAMLYGAAV